MMKPEFNNYLEQFKLSNTLLSRINDIYEIYADVLGFSIDDIFISERMDSRNKQTLVSLWFFDSQNLFEAKDFTIKLNIDAIVADKNILHWELKTQDYDFRSPIENSRFTLTIRQVEITMVSELYASGKNCDHLLRIFKKYIQSNLVSG